MLVKINNNIDKDKVLDILRDNGIDVENVFPNEFEAYMYDELNTIEDYYKGIIGDTTLKRVREEIEVDLYELDAEETLKKYAKMLDETCDLLDKDPIGVHTITNNLSVELKEFSLLNDTVVLKVSNDLFVCDVVVDSEGENVVLFDELEIPLNEFIRV